MWSVQISEKNGWKWCSIYSCDMYIVLLMITLQNSTPEGNAEWEIHTKTPAGLKTWNAVVLAISVQQKYFILNLNLSWLGCSHLGSLFTTEKQKKVGLMMTCYAPYHVRPESCPTKEQARQVNQCDHPSQGNSVTSLRKAFCDFWVRVCV